MPERVTIRRKQNMIERSTVNNWECGNYSDLSKQDLIKLVRYFEMGQIQDDIYEGVEEC